MTRPRDALSRTSLAIAIYLPTTLSMMGIGAITPLIALTARALGASVAEAGLVVSFIAVGGMLGALPAGTLAARVGEKKALTGSLLFSAVMTAVAGLAPHLAILGAAVLAMGVASAVIMLARQSYLTQAIPYARRARAMSLLGGVFRIGAFLGPLLGALVIGVWGLTGAYLMAAAFSVLAAVITWSLPDLPGESVANEKLHTWPVLRANLRTYATVGLGASALMLVRASRDALVPLWSEAHGIDAATTSLIFAAGSAAELLLFYVGGTIMDRYGRRAVAVPTMLVMGTCFALLPLAVTVPTITLVSAGLGLGNGVSSGVVLTLGSDYSPELGRPQFLAGWRLTTGFGQMAGPVLISAVAAVAPLAWASVAIGAVGWVGAAWLWHWAAPPASEPSADAAA